MDIQKITGQTFVARVEHHEVLDSTNSLARRYGEQAAQAATGSGYRLRSGYRLPLLIVADRQTAGRGRGSNRWWTGEGSLAFSLLLAADVLPGDRSGSTLVGLAAAVAVAETVAPLVPDQDASLHWPNDVYAGGRKLAGILVEVLADRQHIIGIGLNVNNAAADAPAELRQTAVSLCDLAGRPFDRTDVLIDLLQRLEQQLAVLRRLPQEVARAANRLCGQTGDTLSIKTGTDTTTGCCLGIADDGGLVLETPQGSRTFYSGILC